jgi:hypothetical protein
MADNFGSGVSRVLDPKKAAFHQVIWQKGKPPLDSELNLIQQLENDWRQQLVLRGTPSGWLGNETNPSEDFVTHPSVSNGFRYGRQRSGEKQAIQWAVVNGWLIPVTGTRTGTPPGAPNDADTWNAIALDPPPSNSGDFRTDFVFLEVWLARVPPAPATLNKPSASAIYRYGNVEGGMSYLPDDVQDPQIGSETTERVQVQYRIRVVKGLLGLSTYPDGFDPSVVKAQGAAVSATSFTFSNMRQELGDPGLWRAGDGTQNSLGTVDGYVYAIPLCGVFRRNSVVWTGDPSPNLNGAFNRNPTATDRSGFTYFSLSPTISGSLTATATTLTLNSASNLPLPSSPATPVLIQIGDELMTYTGITGTTVSGLIRGARGTTAEAHPMGSVIKVISGRPDGLFADQVALTDIIDLRHLVNPNGFDYAALLKANLDKLMRGQLRANWKRTGSGTQGPFVFYQDKVSTSAASLGVTQIDRPDGIRQVFSDAAVQQKVELIVTPYTAAVVPPATQPAGASWSLTINANVAKQAAGNIWTAGGDGDEIVIPIAQFKNSLPGSDADQVRFLNDGLSNAVEIRLDGEADPLNSSQFTVTPSIPGPNDDLVIKLQGVGSPFPTSATPNPVNLYITVHVQYGAGRGLSRRPDSLHSLTVLNPNSNLLVQPGSASGTSNLFPLRTGWALLWSKYRNDVYKNLLPVTSETYADLGSKTVILTPFRVIQFPQGSVGVRTLDGDGLNGGQGLMPPLKTDGITAKWGTTDPLGLFANCDSGLDAAVKNIYVTLPRHLVPGWGAHHVPILPADNATFDAGINYMLMAKKGSALSDADHNRQYVNYSSNAPLSYASFSTGNFSGGVTTTATYNSTFSYSGITHAGARFFTDTRNLGRKGIELPPFYGVARLFAVYESADYKTNGSAFDPATRELTGTGATNLLRQGFTGPTFWVELDDDGDSTFILNAEALDLSKSPTPISTFSSKHYVIEASIFGFDRGSFDLEQPFRLLLSRDRTQANTTGGAPARSNNVNVPIVGPTGILPGPMNASDTVFANYSRTPYQGDAFGSQTNYLDIGYYPGSLQSATAYQIASSQLDESALTRPNQKSLEVLASQGFITTLGTGRLSGDIAYGADFDFRNVGYEDPNSFPPSSGIDDRPTVLPSTLDLEDGEVDGTYLGCTERLPLGALHRDKDFRGARFEVSGGGSAPLAYVNDEGLANFTPSLAKSQKYEQTEITLLPATASSGQPGDVLVHVDGETGSYGTLTNFRTFRGGSAFSAAGSHPGGDVYSNYREIASTSGHTNVLVGKAYLVRNTVTSVGSNEVSAGDELMMLIVTTAYALGSVTPMVSMVRMNTNGTGEGLSAADLYRIEGRPLLSNHVRYTVDPASVTLPSKTILGFY